MASVSNQPSPAQDTSSTEAITKKPITMKEGDALRLGKIKKTGATLGGGEIGPAPSNHATSASTTTLTTTLENHPPEHTPEHTALVAAHVGEGSPLGERNVTKASPSGAGEKAAHIVESSSHGPQGLQPKVTPDQVLTALGKQLEKLRGENNALKEELKTAKKEDRPRLTEKIKSNEDHQTALMKEIAKFSSQPKPTAAAAPSASATRLAAPAPKSTIDYPKTEAEIDKTAKEFKALQKKFADIESKIETVNGEIKKLKGKVEDSTGSKKESYQKQLDAATAEKKTLNEQKSKILSELPILKDSLGVNAKLEEAIPKLSVESNSTEAKKAVQDINKIVVKNVGASPMTIGSSLSDLMANSERILIQREIKNEGGGTTLQEVKPRQAPSNDPTKFMDEADKVLKFIDEDARAGQNTDKPGLTQVPRTFTNAQGISQPVIQGNMLRDASNQNRLDERLTDKQDREIKALSQNIYAGNIPLHVFTPAFGLANADGTAVISSDPKPKQITWTKMADGKTKVEYDMEIDLQHRTIAQQNKQLPEAERKSAVVANGSLKLTVVYDENMQAESFETKFTQA